MTLTELKLIGIWLAELYKDGLIAIYADHSGKTSARAHLDNEAFDKLSNQSWGAVRVSEHSDNYYEYSFEEDGVTFFKLVAKDE